MGGVQILGMPDPSRRWIAGAIRALLALLAIALVVGWAHRRFLSRRRMHVATSAPPPAVLSPGDLRIYNTDSSLDMVLVGDKITEGLSAKTVEKVRTEMDAQQLSDSGFGGSIEKLVKSSVSGAIGTHFVYPLSDFHDLRYEGGRILFDWKDGGEHRMFQGVAMHGKREDQSFRAEDADRFIQAVRARKRQLGQM